MAANIGKAKVDRSNPFLDDQDDDFEFVNGDQIQRQMRQAQQRTLESTKRSLALIDDSHDMACKTAEELVYQGEQLNRIERNLDVIHDDMNVANRHITSMKSIWGTVGNYFKRAPKKTASEIPATEPQPGLGNITTSHAFEPSPSGSKQYGTSPSSNYYRQEQTLRSNDPYERQVNENLDLMSQGLSRLKEDAMILGCEIDRQNEQLPRITMKAETADIKVQKAQKDIRKMLR
ncbi:synaptosomal-associated protein 23 [Exaiptasia diaphana]|uniref:t-SNARE coiled-coil homology domain-containing protein n=1 Tax=Exaiptasia diaphana TaxID=2652724 RepID=A0A913YGS9_EXADI|nr:synaptosomal-associated protein 23 [Exaiptasia diaphana]